MAAPKPTYADYQSWGGQLAEDEFQASLPQAVARVRCRCAAVPDLGALEGDELAAYANAVCAAVDALSDGMAGLSSYTAGKVSATFSSAASQGSTVGAAIERELSGTRLAWAGV